MKLLTSYSPDELFLLMATPTQVKQIQPSGRMSVVNRPRTASVVAAAAADEEIDPMEFDSIVETLMPDDFSLEEKHELFAIFDADGGGDISREEFTRHIEKVVKSTEIEGAAEQPSDATSGDVDIEGGVQAGFNRKSSHQSPEAARAFVESVGGPSRLSGWQMLYCGGAQPVVDTLSSIKKAYGIALKVEKFDW